MYIPDIIKKKRDGKNIRKEDFEFIINGYINNKIPDYQVSSFLMACFINGLSKKETYFLTETMMKSGDMYDFSDIDGIKVDKHSTGGVGDKVSIPLAPLLASLGFYVPMVSGRGLGHSGGTLDKLESINGFNVNLSAKKFKIILKNEQVVMAGQTEKFVPADKKLYALRDVSGTVESIQLITASIMSKKISEGIDSLLLDVKQGNGAFMKTAKQAKMLAESMYEIGIKFNKKMIYAITDMSQVLGSTAGNGIEILESMEILKGKNKNRAYHLVREFAAMIMMKNSIEKSKKDAYKKIDHSINKGYAFEKFLKMVKAQGGNIDTLKRNDLLCNKRVEIKAEKNGYLKEMDTYNIGIALIYLKAGRFTKKDIIDHKTGVYVHKQIGDRVKRGDTVFTVYHNGDYLKAMDILKNVFCIGSKKCNSPKLIKFEKV